MSSVRDQDTPRVRAYEAIADALVARGVTKAFGLVGDDTAKLMVAMADRGIEYFGARHENAAVAMAVGYAFATGEVGVCLLNRGPGMSNGLTAVVNAGKGRSSLFVVTGADPISPAPATLIGGPDGKALDVTGIAPEHYRQFTPTHAEHVLTDLAAAWDSAQSGMSTGLNVPKNLFEALVWPPAPSQPAASTAVRPPSAARDRAIEVAVTLLAQAERPLVVAGRGAWTSGSKDLLEKFADEHGALLTTTLKGKDMFRGHPRDLGLIGTFSHTPARSLIEKADCVLVVGAGLNQFTTSRGDALPDAPLIQIDAHQSSIGRYHPADVGIVGDAHDVLTALFDRLGPGSTTVDPDAEPLLAGLDVRAEWAVEQSRWTVDPRELIVAFDEVLPADRSVVTDTGNFFGHVPAHIRVQDPDHFKSSSDFSAIGLSVGTALGVSVARPEQPTVVFVGDGSMLMTLGEIETIARLQTPLIVAVMNDCSFGAEQHYLELQGVSGALCTYPDTDFAAVATALGVEGVTIRSVEDLRELSDRLASDDSPIVLDCKISRSVPASFIAEALAGPPSTATRS